MPFFSSPLSSAYVSLYVVQGDCTCTIEKPGYSIACLIVSPSCFTRDDISVAR